MTETTLKIENLEFEINGSKILENISIEAHKGEFIGLIGPNGAGKSTFLKCINGINKATQGSILLNGKSLVQLDSRSIAREVALMHQNTTVTFPFPALDIVLSGRYPHLGRMRRESAEDYAIARRYMEFTDTLQFERRPVNQMSGGERQRVLFAKILAQETDIILLDEPTASLDISFEEQIFEYCRKLCRRGKTVIAAVHDLKTASRFCSRLVLMKDGSVIADGTPEEVMTSGNLSESYGVKALVYRDRVSGDLDFHIHGLGRIRGMAEGESAAGKKVHIIGGGGSASGIFRMLFERGCSITAGVFAHGDTDIDSGSVFGADIIVGKPFSEIADEDYMRNVEMIKAADVVILCDMPFGFQNIRNLDAAAYAKRLVIIEEEAPEGRDFTGGAALGKYGELKGKAIVVNNARLHEVL